MPVWARMIKRDATGDAELAGRVQEKAQVLLNTIQAQFGAEGLTALEQCRHRPGQVTPRQEAIASHIRDKMGPDIFWLSEALALWRNTR